MLVEPRPPDEVDAVAGLQHRLPLARAAAAHQPEVAAMRRVITSRMALVSPCLLVPRIIASSRHSMSRAFHGSGREFKPHLAVALGVVAPVLAHLHEQEQMHLLLEDLGDLLARRPGRWRGSSRPCGRARSSSGCRARHRSPARSTEPSFFSSHFSVSTCEE